MLLPLSLLVAALWERGAGTAALRTSLAFAWLLVLAPALPNQSLTVAADALALEPRWVGWLAYGLAGLSLDRSIKALGARLIEDKMAPSESAGMAGNPPWTWIGAGLALALLGMELTARFGQGPMLSGALTDILRGLGSSAARSREFMALTRPTEWLGTLAGMAIATASLALGVRALGRISPARPAHRALMLLAGLGLYAGAASITLPAGLLVRIGPGLLSQLLVLWLPLAAYLINMADQSPKAVARGGLLLAWVLVVGWMPLLGWSTVGDRIYIVAAFLGGEGLPTILLGQAVVATVVGGLVWLRRDLWLRPVG